MMNLTKKDFFLLSEKLTAADLHCIRYSTMLSTARLAEIFGVSVWTIERARANSFFRSRGDRVDFGSMRKAHRAVREALTRGALVRQPCEVCETTLNVEAHHDDYNLPLVVRWLCASHHFRFHLGLRQRGKARADELRGREEIAGSLAHLRLNLPFF
jgi:hypothetical protein